MKPTSDLFDLIKSLSSNEKRYFKLFAISVGGKENSAYMRLFNAVDGMAVYDEQILKDKFKNEAFIKQLSVAKNYLYHVILKSLVQSNAENTTQIKLAVQVAQAELLLEKGLLEQCQKFISLTRKELKRVEDFHLLDKLIDIEGRILLKQFAFPQMFKNTEEQFQIYKCRLITMEYRKRAIEMFSYNQQVSNNPTETNLKHLENLITPLLENEPPKDCGTAANFYYYTCINFYYGAVRDAPNRLKYAQIVMDLLEKNPGFVEMNPRLYYSATSNLCQALLGMSDYKRVELLLKQTRAKSMEPNSGIKKEIQQDATAALLNAEILLYINNKQYEKAAKLDDTVNEIMGKDKAKLGNFYFFELNFNLAHALFLNGNYQAALDYIENILRLANNEQRRDLHLASRIFQIVLHYELGSKRLLQNIADTTIRYLKRQGVLTQFDTILINYLRKAGDNKKELLKELQQMITKGDKNKLSLMDGYIDIKTWMSQQQEKAN